MKNDPKMPSQRQLRVGEQIRHIIADTLVRGHFKNPLLFDSANNVTVTEVRVSPDLKHATAYVISLGGLSMDDLLPALNEEAYAFQKAVGQQSEIKFTPKIRFLLDGSFDNAQRLENILGNITYSDQEE